MHAQAELLPHFRRALAFVIAFRTSQAVGAQLPACDSGGVALKEGVLFKAFVNNCVHPGAVLVNAHEIHDLSNADDAFLFQKRADFRGFKGSAAAFQAWDRRHAGGSQHILAQSRLLRVFQHKFYALDAHDISDFVGIGADSSSSPGENSTA